MMDNAHLILIGLWVAYCILHSFLAHEKVKNLIRKISGKWYKYYRPLYSLFAAATLALLLYFQFSIKSIRLFNQSVFIYLPATIIIIIGLCIMIICIKKYFYELSGLQALQHAQAKNTLQQSGLHKYVRHPLYAGTLLFSWGLFFVFPLMSNFIAVTILSIYVVAGIRLEEKKLVKEYGDAYSEYSRKVQMLIPSIGKIKKGSL